MSASVISLLGFKFPAAIARFDALVLEERRECGLYSVEDRMSLAVSCMIERRIRALAVTSPCICSAAAL